MPLWLKRSLFLLVAGVAAWVEDYYLAQYGFEYVAFALLITVILAIGWMRTSGRAGVGACAFRPHCDKSALLWRPSHMSAATASGKSTPARAFVTTAPVRRVTGEIGSRQPMLSLLLSYCYRFGNSLKPALPIQRPRKLLHKLGKPASMHKQLFPERPSLRAECWKLDARSWIYPSPSQQSQIIFHAPGPSED